MNIDNKYEDRIKNILKMVKGPSFEYENNLLTDYHISSFDMIKIISMIEKEFNVKLAYADLQPEDFNSVSGICSVVIRNLSK